MEENDEVAKDMTNTLQNQLKLIQMNLRQTGVPPETFEDLQKESLPPGSTLGMTPVRPMSETQSQLQAPNIEQ